MTDTSDGTDPIRSDDQIDALVADAYRPIDESVFDTLVTKTTNTPLAPPRAGRSKRATVSRRWLGGLSVAAALVLVGLIVVAGGGGDGKQVADRPHPSVGDTSAGDPAAGPPVTLRYKVESGGGPISPDEARTATAVLGARLQRLSIDADVSVTDDVVRIELHDPSERDAVDAVVGVRGDLQFRPVMAGPFPPAPGDVPTRDPVASEPAVLGDGRAGEPLLYEVGPALSTPAMVEQANREESRGRPVLRIVLRDGTGGIDAFNALAGECYSRTQACPTGRMAIVLDGTVLTAPDVLEPRFERDGIQIVGDFTAEEADAIAAALMSEALPFRLVAA